MTDDYDEIPELLQELYATWKTLKADLRQSHTRQYILFAGMLSDFKRYMTDLQEIIDFDIRIKDWSLLILDALPMLKILVERNEYLRCTEILSMMVNHPRVLPISKEHPYVLRLYPHLQDKLDTEIYNAAWERGKSLDLVQTIQELCAEFSAIYNVS